MKVRPCRSAAVNRAPCSSGTENAGNAPSTGGGAGGPRWLKPRSRGVPKSTATTLTQKERRLTRRAAQPFKKRRTPTKYHYPPGSSASRERGLAGNEAHPGARQRER